MATLTGTTIASTYEQLIKLDTETLGDDGSAKFLETGKAENTPIAVSTNRVGIGTASPKNLLEIQSITDAASILTMSRNDTDTAIANNDALATIQFSGYDSTNTYAVGAMINARADGAWDNASSNYAGTDLEFFTQDGTTSDNSLSTPRMIINSVGNVGIGTATPTYALDVVGDMQLAGSTPIMYFTPTSDSQSSRIIFEATDGTDKGSILYGNASYSGGADYMSFQTNGVANERMRIDSSGNVGIGTTSPARQLSISRDAAAQMSMDSYSDTASYGSSIYITRARGTEDVPDLVQDGDEIGEIVFLGWLGSNGDLHTGSKYDVGAAIVATCTATPDNADEDIPCKLTFKTTPDGSSGSSPRLTILADGNVGIGTVSPDYQLEISKDSANAGLTLSSYDNTEATAPTIILRKGEGTEASHASAVDDDCTLGVLSFQGFDSNTFEIGAQILARTNGTPGDEDMPTDLEFWTNDGGDSLNQRMTIIQDGNVGINAVAPITKLEVVVDNNDGVNGLFINMDDSTNNKISLKFDHEGTGDIINAAGSSSGQFKVKSDGDCENTDNDYGAVSDARLKENITDCTPKLDDINELRIVNFNFKDMGDGHKQIGLIADEAKEVFPALVKISDCREYNEETDEVISGYEDQQSFSYSVLVPILVKAVQELSAKVEALESA